MVQGALIAIQRQVPVALLAKPGEVLAIAPLKGTDWVYAGVKLQVASVGANRLKVMLPVGLKPPLNVAESLSIAPTLPLAGFGVVAMVGWP